MNRPSHQRVLLGLLLALPLLADCSGGGGITPPSETAAPPNVLLVILDCVRADHVGAYGYDGGTTPNLDALARDGLLFERAYAPATWTVPSHASMFTGRHTDLGQMPEDEGTGIAPWTPTVAGLLGASGYRTGFFGNAPMMWEWPTLARGFSKAMTERTDNPVPHMIGDRAVPTELPHRRGGSQGLSPQGVDQESQGPSPQELARGPKGPPPPELAQGPPKPHPLELARGPKKPHPMGLARGPQGPPSPDGDPRPAPRRPDGPEILIDQYSLFSYTTPPFLQWLDEAPADEPFFAFVHANDAHFPYACGSVLQDGRPTDAHNHLMAKIVHSVEGAKRAASSNPEEPLPPEGLTGEEIRSLTAAYDECVTQADQGLGTLVQALRDRGQLDNTLLIIAADHGESLGDGGNYGHGTTHGNTSLGEELIRVPLVVHYPDGGVAGRHDQPVSLVDLFPTILETVGIDGPPSDGVSLWEADKEEQEARRIPVRGARASLRTQPGETGRMDHFAVVDGDAKVVVTYGETAVYRLPGLFGEEPIEDTATAQRLLDGIYVPSERSPHTVTREPAATARQMNLVVVELPALRRDVLLGANARLGDTPALTRLLRESVAFDRAVAASHWTLPAMATLLTGRQPFSHGVLERTDVLSDTEWTLAEVVAANGYRTAAFTGGLDTRAAFGLEQGFERYDDVGEHDLRALREAVPLAGSWMSGLGNEPFFLLLSGYDLHAPWHSSSITAGRPGALDCDDLDAQWLTQWRDPGDGSDSRLPGGDSVSSETLVAGVADCYHACLLDVDEALGDLYRLLEQQGRLNDTIIVLVGDHGESLGERGHMTRYHEQETHSEVSRIPLLIQLPRQRGAGTRVNRWIGATDVMPTLLDILAMEAPVAMDGISFAGEFDLDAEPPPVDVDGAMLTLSHDSMAFLSESGLLVSSLAGAPVLYPLFDDDLVAEAEELDDPEARRTAMALFARYAMSRELEVTPQNDRRSEVDPAFIELLRRYGYWDAADDDPVNTP